MGVADHLETPFDAAALDDEILNWVVLIMVEKVFLTSTAAAAVVAALSLQHLQHLTTH